MKTFDFKDSRGIQYGFTEYSIGEVRVTQKLKKGGTGYKEVVFSKEALNEFLRFLGK